MKRIDTLVSFLSDSAKKGSPKLLLVFAHPDDESLNSAGLIIKANEENIKTYLICLTKGEKSNGDDPVIMKYLKKERTKELKRAGNILNLHKILICDFGDGVLINHQDRILRTIKESIEEIKPDIIVTHDPSGMSNHPDHIITSYLTKLAVTKYFNSSITILFRVHEAKIKKLLKMIKRNELKKWGTMPAANCYLDTYSYIDKMEKACLAHTSQHLENCRPLGYRKWHTLIDKEYYHLVNNRRPYIFKLLKYQSKCFNYQPNKEVTFRT